MKEIQRLYCDRPKQNAQATPDTQKDTEKQLPDNSEEKQEPAAQLKVEVIEQKDGGDAESEEQPTVVVAPEEENPEK